MLVGPIGVAFLLVFRMLRHERVIPVLARPEFDVDPIVLILDSLHCHRPFLSRSRSRSRARTHTHGCIGTKEKRNRSRLNRGHDGNRIYRMTSVQSRAIGCICVYATEAKERTERLNAAGMCTELQHTRMDIEASYECTNINVHKLQQDRQLCPPPRLPRTSSILISR